MKILLVGGDGFLGKKLCAKLPYRVSTATHDALDICNAPDVGRFFEKSRPEMAILAAALTNVDGCEKDRRRAYDVNVAGTKNVVEACLRHGAGLVFFSTDYVFDGEKGNYSEDDRPNPINYYGKTKFLAEEAIRESGIDFVIERVSVLYGYNDSQDKQTFGKWVVNNLKENIAINVVQDQFSCPTLIDDIARATELLIEKGQRGTFHVSGPECLSRHRFALNIAETFGLDKSLVCPVNTESLNQPAPRPKNSCLSTEKIKKLGIEMSDTKTGLEIMRGCFP